MCLQNHTYTRTHRQTDRHFVNDTSHSFAIAAGNKISWRRSVEGLVRIAECKRHLSAADIHCLDAARLQLTAHHHRHRRHQTGEYDSRLNGC